MIAYLQGEAGGDVVESILKNDVCYAHSINLCEVYYQLLHDPPPQRPDGIWTSFSMPGSSSVPTWGERFGKPSALIKPGAASLADCFCLALAQIGGPSRHIGSSRIRPASAPWHLPHHVHPMIPNFFKDFVDYSNV